MNETKPNILLVEDDQNFGDVLKSYLEMHDYNITLRTDGEAGKAAFQNKTFDLCIFDVMMPKKDGFTLAKEIRSEDKKTPIIFLTAKSLNQDIVEGLKIGADDYITKPFNSEELLLRVQAILKRSHNGVEEENDQTEFNFGKFSFNFPLRTLTYTGESKVSNTKLSPKEAQLLRLFCIHMNNVLTRTEALTKIWGEDNYFTARSMDVFVTKLRKYLKKDEDIEIINIHGNGFQLLVKEEAAE
ncbi:response regulator transcription factor [Membranihabitans marinus]|uniref:response regulator transcription factor n=1 Tax=Membranihabitans marinus TaxID=1227546 RepID=UPI001F456E3B|nr:response regulator transcription factor [Membranihabitans marinus]